MVPVTKSIWRNKCSHCGTFHASGESPPDHCPVCGERGEDLWIESEIKLPPKRTRIPRPTLPAESTSAIPSPGMTKPLDKPFQKTMMITLFNNCPGSQIFYTINGKKPDGRSILYAGPFMIKETTEVRAVSKVGNMISPEVRAIFYKEEFAPGPEFSPSGGRHSHPIYVALKNRWPGAKVYYSLNGAAFVPYKESLYLNSDTAIRAKSVKPDGRESLITAQMFLFSTSIDHDYEPYHLPGQVERFRTWIFVITGLLTLLYWFFRDIVYIFR